MSAKRRKGCDSSIYADLSAATAATIAELREALMVHGNGHCPDSCPICFD